MNNRRITKASNRTTLAGVKKEMAKLRVAKSAQKKYASLLSPGLVTKEKKAPRRDEAGKSFEYEARK